MVSQQKNEVAQEEAIQPQEPAVDQPPQEAVEIYDLHIKVAEEYRQQLKDATQLAYKLGRIPEPQLTELMILFIGWGLAILKKDWLDRMGYK